LAEYISNMSRKYNFNNPVGLYFTSTTVIAWTDLFTRPLYKHIIVDSLKFCRTNKGLQLFAWCLMTNHLHLVFRMKEGFLAQNFMRDFKKWTSVQLLEAIKQNDKESRKKSIMHSFTNAGNKNANNEKFQLWIQNNHPIELTTNKMIDDSIDYVHNNPVVAEIVDKPEHYLYSSARDYAGIPGLIPLDIE